MSSTVDSEQAGDADATALVRRTMPLCETLGVVAHEFGPDRVVLGVDWRPELCTSNGLLHGGVMMALADSAGAGCAVLNLPDGAVGTSTIESKTNFLAPAPVGTKVIGECLPLHRGKRTMVWQTRVTSEGGRLIAMVTQTQMVLEPQKT